jgi:hypothetical protein
MADQPQPDSGIQPQPPPPTVQTTGIQENTSSDAVIHVPPMPPAPAPPAVDTGWTKFDIVLFLMLATLCFFLGSFAANNHDFWHHLATGRLIAQGDYQFGVDPFSFASHRDGTPILWVNHAWLYDLLLYLLYSAAGERGVVIVHGLLTVALFVILLKTQARDGSRLTALLIAGLAVLVVSQRLPINSLMASYLLLGALLLLLGRGGALATLTDEAPLSPRALWAVPLLFALWVNLDAYFILGLMILVLVVLGNALGGALGWNRRGQVKTQVFVLVLSVAACLLNPHHVHAFALPGDLAYLMGSALPSSVAGSGEALRGLLRHDVELVAGYGLISPLTAAYISSTGQHIAGLAYFALLLVSFLSFVVVVIVHGPRAGGAGLPLARLLAWGLVTVLSLIMYRMIPFFAVVAGPITLLNFADCARAARRRPGAAEARGFNPKLAGFAAAVLVLIALALAWPGWLHVRIGSNSWRADSSRRVAWHVQQDPALRAAAEALAQAQARHVFNFSSDIAQYCAWFAPGVRCYVDHRLALFPHEAARYAKTKLDLRLDAGDVEERRKPVASGWREVFHLHKIDHIAMTKFLEPQQKIIVQMFWLQPWHWTQRYADGRATVFGWSPTARQPTFDLLGAWNREAFGAGAAERPVPRDAVEPPQSGTSLETWYLQGEPTGMPPRAAEPLVHALYFGIVQRRWPLAYHPAWHVANWLGPFGISGVAPGSVLGPHGLLIATSNLWQVGHPPRDPGPPAAPLLMIRQARRTLHSYPLQPFGYFTLYEGTKLQSFVEDFWNTRTGMQVPVNDRTNIRQVQRATALRNYLDLEPEDWTMRLELANVLNEINHRDAGLEQLALARKALERNRGATRDKRVQDALRAQEKDLTDFYKMAERELKQRRNDYDLKAARLEPFQKFALAVRAPYQTVDASNRAVLDDRGLGLAQEGLKQLQTIPPDSLKEGEKTALHYWRFRLLAQQGRISEASSELSLMAPGPAECLLWHAAALGDYVLMERALAGMDAQHQQALPPDELRAKLRNWHVGVLNLSALSQLPALSRGNVLALAVGLLAQAGEGYTEAVRTPADLRTLRGILALEIGNTAKAEEHFAEALRLTRGAVYFADRPIAQRYLELLHAQKN